MSAQPIVPFWNRLPDISRYPFRGGALYTLIALAVGQTLLGWLPIVGGLLWVLSCKSAFEMLQSSADGHTEAPPVASGLDNSLVWKYLVMQILGLLVPIAIGLITTPAIGVLLFIALLIAQPAAIMGLALTGSLERGLSPGLWMEVMRRVGWPYLALVGLLLVIQLSAANAASLLDAVLPAFLARAVAVTFSLWSMFATFHLMGYLIYQYHEVLDYAPASHELAKVRPPLFDRDAQLLATVGEKVQQGDTAGARELLGAEIRSRLVGSEGHELYRRLLQQAGDTRGLVEHGRTFLHLLLMEKQDKRALALARECLELDPRFSAALAEQNAQLADRARFAGQSDLAIRLWLAAIDHPDRHPDAVRWGLLASDLISRQAGREGEARSLLLRLRQGCEDTTLIGKLDAQLAAIPA